MARPESSGYAEETELHRTIRGGADFHLAEEMREMVQMMAENRKMRGQAKRARKNANRRKARKRRRQSR